MICPLCPRAPTRWPLTVTSTPAPLPTRSRTLCCPVQRRLWPEAYVSSSTTRPSTVARIQARSTVRSSTLTPVAGVAVATGVGAWVGATVAAPVASGGRMAPWTGGARGLRPPGRAPRRRRRGHRWPAAPARTGRARSKRRAPARLRRRAAISHRLRGVLSLIGVATRRTEGSLPALAPAGLLGNGGHHLIRRDAQIDGVVPQEAPRVDAGGQGPVLVLLDRLEVSGPNARRLLGLGQGDLALEARRPQPLARRRAGRTACGGAPGGAPSPDPRLGAVLRGGRSSRTLREKRSSHRSGELSPRGRGGRVEAATVSDPDGVYPKSSGP